MGSKGPRKGREKKKKATELMGVFAVFDVG